VMSARIETVSSVDWRKTSNQRRARAEAAEGAARQALVHGGAAAHFERPQLIDPESRFTADIAAEVKRRRRAVALCSEGKRHREADVFANLEVRIEGCRVELVSAGIVVPVIQVLSGLEQVTRRAEVEIDARGSRDRSARRENHLPSSIAVRELLIHAVEGDLVEQVGRPVDLGVFGRRLQSEVYRSRRNDEGRKGVAHRETQAIGGEGFHAEHICVLSVLAADRVPCLALESEAPELL